MAPHTRSARHAPLPPLVLGGLGAQLVGVSAQAAFHLSDGAVSWLTETRTSVVDHVASNAGVICLAWQTTRWLRDGTASSSAGRRLLVLGTAVEVAGAVADGADHLLGGESRAAFAAIGVGLLLAGGGAVVSARAGRGE